jgi:hypothetical protein
MSEMRRAARELVEPHTESFESRHDAATSRDRLATALQRAKLETGPTLKLAWREEDGKTILDASFLPSRRTLHVLRGLSLAMLGLLLATAWILMQPGEGAQRFLVPMFAVLSILALPLLTLGLSSSRAAREARIRRAIRIALQDMEN